MTWLSPSRVQDLVALLPTLQISAGLAGFLYSLIVRWQKLRDKAELFIAIQSALAAATIPTAFYLILGAFAPELLAQLPGLRYYVAVVGAVALFIAVSTLASAIP